MYSNFKVTNFDLSNAKATSMTTSNSRFSLNTKAIKNAITNYCGVPALVRQYKGNQISVFIKTGNKEDYVKVEKFFMEFGIVRVMPDMTLKAPFQINSGEYNSLIGIIEN